jgi:glutathione S-transferase
MKMYWSSRSPFVRKAMVVAHEVGVADRIEKIPVVVSSTMKPTADVMKNNPLNKIPTLITDEGITLFESVVVCEYLDSTFNKGAKLFPASGLPRWKALRWQALGSGMLEVEVAWRSETRRPHPHPVAVAAFEEKAKTSLDVLEQEVAELKATPYNIGHISIASALSYLDFRFAEDLDWRKGHPQLAAWYEDVSKRPAMQATAHVDA